MGVEDFLVIDVTVIQEFVSKTKFLAQKFVASTKHFGAGLIF